MSVRLSKPPQNLREEFFNLKSREDIARLLEIEVKQLNFHLYILPPNKKYKVFTVPKKSGKHRQISAPASPIKILQWKLKQVLEAVYIPKPATYGFVSERDIVKNARLHKKRRYVLNIDLEDFFPSIHFGRVRGMFMKNPYNLNNEVATILAQICCYEKMLPQGAPTSPIISNMICARLDAKLTQLAKKHFCTYSRYADDITFSTNRSKFPSALAYLTDIGQIELGDELTSLIEENGFKVNRQKIRLQTRNRRQEVTGLVVNKYPNVPRKYVKRVRAILYAWKKYGRESTAQNYFEKHARHKYPDASVHRPPFEKIVLGKIQFIGMVKGQHSPTYLRLLREFCRLAPEYYDSKRLMNLSTTKPFIYTEGKTDRKHIEAALKNLKAQGLFSNLNLEFSENDIVEGADRRLQELMSYRGHLELHTRPHIFIFDRDRLDILREIKGNEEFVSWGNGVYSFAIPIPKHREGMQRITIEFYYKDEDIICYDENGRRLFFSADFDAETGIHLSEPDLKCKNLDILKSGESKIIFDEIGVFDQAGKNVALSKNSFADYMFNATGNFAGVDFSGFKPLFERIQVILSEFDSERP